jgi:hypothetical protein
MKIHSAQITGSKPAIVPSFATNPSTPNIGDGSIWVNSANSAINFSFASSSVAAEAWSAGGIKTGYMSQTGGAGNSANSAISFGGCRYSSGLPSGYPSLNNSQCTQEYDGTSWTDGGNLTLAAGCNQARGGVGSQNSSLAFGGYIVSVPSFNSPRSHACTEEYDGTSWTDASAAMPHGRYCVKGVGTQTAAIVHGGICQTSPNTCYGCKETWGYDGSVWASCNNSTYPKRNEHGIFGTINAAVVVGNCNAPYYRVEEWDGTSWASGTDLTTGQAYAGGFGTANVGIIAGGKQYPSNTYCTATQKYDGTVWSAGTSLSGPGRYNVEGVGDSISSGLIFGSWGLYGNNSLNSACTEELAVSNESTFVSKELVAKEGILSASAGDYGQFDADGGHRSGSFSGSFQGSLTGDGSGITGVSAALPSGTVSSSAQLSHAGFGNISGSSVSTGSFGIVEAPKIGTSNTTLYGDAGNLTNVATSNAIQITGSFKVQSTEPIQIAELNSDPAIATLGPGSVWINKNLGTLNFAYVSASILDKTWAAGGTFIGAKCCIGGHSVSATDGLVWGGKSGNSFAQCLHVQSYEYDGTSWVQGGSTNIGSEDSGGAGTQNASLKVGGRCCGPNYFAQDYKQQNETYDGSSWSNSANMGRTAIAYRGLGNQNSAIFHSGVRPANQIYYQRYTEGWDGSAWTTCNDTIQTTGWGGSLGTVGAAVMGGGSASPYACTEEWDGTSWASGNALGTARYCLFGGGTQNAGIVFGGHSSNTYACTECYNGTTWAAATVLSQGRCEPRGGGSSIGSILAISSVNSATRSCTEEWTEGYQNTMLVKQVTGSAHSY